MGGVPQYLKAIQKGESATQAIDHLFFTRHGALKDEFKILYESLYDNATHHIAVISLLYDAGKGMKSSAVRISVPEALYYQRSYLTGRVWLCSIFYTF
jgi:hypothetical protein